MKIKVEVDLSDFYDESDGELSFKQSIKDAIAYDVKNQVLAHFKEVVALSFRDEVIKKVNEEKEFFISNVIKEFINSKELRRSNYGDKMITVAEYVEEVLKQSQVSDNAVSKMVELQTKAIHELVIKQSDAITQEFKDRYDMMFAAQMVSKMKSVGLIDEKVAQSLIGKGSEQ